MTAISRFRNCGKQASIRGVRSERMAVLSARWAERRGTHRLRLANRALTRCSTILSDEARAWAHGNTSVRNLIGRLEQQLSAAVQEITGAPISITVAANENMRGQQPRRPTPVTPELARTQRLIGLVERAAGHAWKPVERLLPANSVIDYHLGGRILALAGVDVDAERQRLHTAMEARRYGERLNLALGVRHAFFRDVADALDAWTDQTASSPALPALRLA